MKYLDLTGLTRFWQDIKPVNYTVTLNADGTVNTVDSGLTYATVKAALNSGTRGYYLDVVFGELRFSVKALENSDTENDGDILFIGTYISSDSTIRLALFSLTSSDALTVNHVFLESWNFKVQDVIAYANNTLTYPSTKAVYDQFQRKPVVIWEVADASEGLTGLNTNLSTSYAWQLQNLDMTPYKFVRAYFKAGRKTGKGSADSSIVPSAIIDISLDDRAAQSTMGYFIASHVGQNPNDANRLALTTVAINGAKTAFAVVRQTSLYGTAATSNTDVYAYCFKLEGYYD